MSRDASALFWLLPAAALVLPPLLLVPLVYHLPGAQFFKDIYEACLWLSPAVGVAVLVALYRRRRRHPGQRYGLADVAAIILACLDLASPLFFYLVLAVLAGR